MPPPRRRIIMFLSLLRCSRPGAGLLRSSSAGRSMLRRLPISSMAADVESSLYAPSPPTGIHASLIEATQIGIFAKFRIWRDDDRAFTILVLPIYTIGTLKCLIYSLTRRNMTYPPEQALIYGNKLLDEDNSTIRECGIKDQDQILVLLRKKKKLFSIYSYKLKEDIYILLPCYDTIGSLKKMIHEEVGVPPEKQILKTADKEVLDDDESRLARYFRMKHDPPLSSRLFLSEQKPKKKTMGADP